MSKQTINIGASPNDGTGTPLRTSFDYTNQNFTELYTALGGGVGLPGATTQVIFNDGGTNLAGDAGLVYNKTTDALTVAGLVTAGSASITGDLTVDTSTLVVDATNDRVGIGTATPGSRLDVRFSTNPAINNAVPTNALRVFTSVAQAVDVGGQIGLGGLYNATDFQAFGNISGKKENSTSGNNAGYLVVGTCDSGGTMNERARFNSTGAFVLAGGTTSANGVGVAFPATQVASSDANCLDDYEEGTWTPAYSPVTGAFTTLPTVSSGQYRKIGNTVFVWGNLRTAGTVVLGAASGDIQITGLPFTCSAASGYGTSSIFQQFNLAVSSARLGISITPSTTIATITKNLSNAGASYVQASELSTATGNFENLIGFFAMYTV